MGIMAYWSINNISIWSGRNYRRILFIYLFRRIIFVLDTRWANDTKSIVWYNSIIRYWWSINTNDNWRFNWSKLKYRLFYSILRSYVRILLIVFSSSMHLVNRSMRDDITSVYAFAFDSKFHRSYYDEDQVKKTFLHLDIDSGKNRSNCLSTTDVNV